MAEESDNFSGTKIVGDYQVTYDNGKETGREYYGPGSGGSGNGGDSGGSGEGGPSGSGDGGRSARVSAIRAACQSIRDSLRSFVQNVQSSISTFHENFSRTISQSVSSVKAAVNKLIPQTSRTKATQTEEQPLVPEPATPAETVQPEETESDPVIISSGLNRQTSTDLTLGTFGGSYAVTRHYAPCSGKGGLLGSSWASSLDTRIIRGLDPDRSEEINKLKSALSAIQAKKAEIEALDSSYDEVKGEIAAAIAGADSAAARIRSELGPLEEAQAVRERSLELNRHVMYGGAGKHAPHGRRRAQVKARFSR